MNKAIQFPHNNRKYFNFLKKRFNVEYWEYKAKGLSENEIYDLLRKELK
jgi:hypothetical protein